MAITDHLTAILDGFLPRTILLLIIAENVMLENLLPCHIRKKFRAFTGPHPPNAKQFKNYIIRLKS